MKKILLISTFTLLCLNMYAQNPAFVTDSLDQYIKREMTRWNIPGVAIVIVKDGDIVVNKGYGVTDTETKQAVDENSLFMIASNTKLFTGTAVALLENQNRLSLNDQVVEHIPYFKMYNDTLTNMVTVEDLLTHRMGFETFQGDFYNWANNASRKEIIENISRNKPVYDFRDTWGYCNAGFVAAGEVIHAVTDTTWEDFIQYNFFNKMDMNRSSVSNAKIVSDKNACKPYTVFNGELIKLNYDNIDNIGPCASINSCTNDLSKWLITQLQEGTYKGKPIFPATVINQVRLPRSIVGDGHSGLYKSKHFDLYGLGIEINDYEGREIYSHTGGANGFVTATCMIPEEGLGIAILTNTDANYFFLACLYQVIEAYFNVEYRNISQTYHNFYTSNQKSEEDYIKALNNQADIMKTRNAEIAVASNTPTSSLNKKYTGIYKNEVYGNLEINLVDDQLIITFEHHPQLKGFLRQTGENKFVCFYDPVSWGVKEIPFIVNDDKVMGVTVTVNDFIDFGEYVFLKQ